MKFADKLKDEKLFEKSFAVIMWLAILFFILGTGIMPMDRNDWGDAIEITNGWTMVYEDGSREFTDVLEKTNKIDSGFLAWEVTLPETIAPGTYIGTRSSRQRISIYVGDELRAEYSSDYNRIIGKETTSGYVLAVLSESDGGKTLRVESVADGFYAGRTNPVYIGPEESIWHEYRETYSISVYVAMFLIIFSLIALLAQRILVKKLGSSLTLKYLSTAMLLAALWIFTGSKIAQMFIPNASVAGDSSMFFGMLFMLPFLFYFDRIQECKYKKMYRVMEIVLFYISLLLALGYIFSIISFIVASITEGVILVIYSFIIIALFAIDLIKGRAEDYKAVAVTVIVVQVLLFAQIGDILLGVGSWAPILYSMSLLVLLYFEVFREVHYIFNMNRDKARAEAANKSKSLFLANMSHEIRTPINSIMGMNEMIIRECTDSNIAEYAETVKNSCNLLLGIVNDILDFSKIEAGKMDIIPNDYRTAEMLDALLRVLKERAEQKNLAVKTEISPELPSTLLGDEVRIKQIIMNFLSNAVKYTNEGSVTFGVKWIVQNEKEGLFVSVEDTGIGIKEEDLSVLFEKFKRVDEKKNASVEGTGLGMSIAESLTEAMGGEINVSSVYGEGSTFTVFIPQTAVDPKPIGENWEISAATGNKSEKYKASFVAAAAKVLLVDDNRTNRIVVKSLLKQTKINVYEAADGFECLQMCKNNKYDIILMDHMMPNMDGVETFKRLKKECANASDIPVIMLTANAISTMRDTFKDAGFTDFLPKPVDYRELEKMLIKYLPSKKFTLN